MLYCYTVKSFYLFTFDLSITNKKSKTMINYKNTKHVTAQKSLTTKKVLVKMSNVAYGHIEDNKLILTSKPTESVLHSLTVFAEKNSLTIQH